MKTNRLIVNGKEVTSVNMGTIQGDMEQSADDDNTSTRPRSSTGTPNHDGKSISIGSLRQAFDLDLEESILIAQKLDGRSREMPEQSISSIKNHAAFTAKCYAEEYNKSIGTERHDTHEEAVQAAFKITAREWGFPDSWTHEEYALFRMLMHKNSIADKQRACAYLASALHHMFIAGLYVDRDSAIVESSKMGFGQVKEVDGLSFARVNAITSPRPDTSKQQAGTPTQEQPQPKKKGKISQRVAAQQCGVSLRELQYWEKGTRTPDRYTAELRKSALAFSSFAAVYRGEHEAIETISNYNPAGGGSRVTGANSQIASVRSRKNTTAKEPPICPCGTVGEMKNIGGAWQCDRCNGVTPQE